MNQLPGYGGLFEGREGHMMFSHNISLVDQNKFFIAGCLVGMSLTHREFAVFIPSVYHLMCGLTCAFPGLI